MVSRTSTLIAIFLRKSNFAINILRIVRGLFQFRAISDATNHGRYLRRRDEEQGLTCRRNVLKRYANHVDGSLKNPMHVKRGGYHALLASATFLT